MNEGLTGQRPRAAVVGSGVAGLVAAYVLSADHDVTLYEADDRLGGHADTHDVDIDGRTIGVDTGFIVHNDRTYPTLLRLFDDLGIRTQASEMSMSVRDDARGLEYAGALGLSGLFPGAANLRDRDYLRMLGEVPRFHRVARATLAEADGDDDGFQTVGEFVTAQRFSAYFQEEFLVPMIAAVWSCEPAMALAYPARYLFRFLDHHGMLGILGSPSWRTVTGGSGEYVRRVAKNLADVRTSSPVTTVAEHDGGVQVTSLSRTETYAKVVIATHPDQALQMLAEPTALQTQLLRAIPYSRNIAQLHTDERLLPRNPRARASWNFQHRDDRSKPVLVTYDLTRLQRLESGDRRMLVTLGGADVVDPGTVLATMDYAHPQYSPTSVAARGRLRELDTDRVAFAGAYHGWGFHEDGALSGREAAERLGGRWPERTAGPARTPALYETRISHARTEPIGHSFTHRSHTWLVDLDDLPTYTGRQAPLRLLAGFRAEDHIGDPSRSIRENVDAFLAEQGIDLAGGRIQMLASPRVLGYVFNPISVYWCFDAGAALAAVVLEVHNTYGGRYAYLIHTDDRGRAKVDKQLYVSPFNDTSGTYAVQAPVPGDRLGVTVTLQREDHAPFVATVSGRALPADARTVLRTSLRQPLTPLVTSARIRRHGIHLWRRGLPVQPRPKESPLP
ncbi:MAG: DUF1365 family protein [Nostocoides sp.]